MRKGEIACYKQFLLFSQCFLLYMVLIFHFKCTLKCRLQFVSIWTGLKFCHLVMDFLIKLKFFLFGKWLALHHKTRSSENHKEKCLWTCGEKEKMLITSISPPIMFSLLPNSDYSFLFTFRLVSAILFQVPIQSMGIWNSIAITKWFAFCKY